MGNETISLREYFEEKIALLREVYDSRINASAEALKIAQREMDRRLAELNNLRSEVLQDRGEFVRKEEYNPAHEELRRQRTVDAEKMIQMTSDVKSNATDIASMKSSLMWLSRLIIGAIILAIIAYIFQKLRP